MGRFDQPAFEILHMTDNVVGKLDGGTKTIRAISASEAFRKYDWLRDLPVSNAAGDLRGMVVSGRWRTVFTVSSNIADALGNIAIVVGVAANLAESAPRISAILHSSDSWDGKAARISTQVSSVAIRTLGGVIPAAASIAFFAAQGYCQIGGAVSTKGAQQCVSDLKAADAWVSSTFKKITDGDNIYLYINTNLVLK